jgi:hypothetical protein
MLMKMMIAAAMTCNVVQAWSTPLGTVYDPSNPCMRSCLEILYDSHCVDACQVDVVDQDMFLLLRVKEQVAETSNAETKKTHTRRGGLGAPVEATESARAQTEQVAETSNVEKKKTHTRRGGLGAPVEATKSARAQTEQVAETSKPWSTPRGTAYDPNNACMVKCREVVHDVTVFDETVCLTCMVNMYDALCIDACPGGANYVAPIEATMTARTHLRSIIAALKDLPSVVIADS